MYAKKSKSSAQEEKKPTEKKKKPEFHEDSLNFEESKNGIDQNSKKGVSEPIIKNMSLNENNERHQKQIIELKTEIKKLKEESENWKKILEIKEKDCVDLKSSYDLVRQNKFQGSTHSTTPKNDRKIKKTFMEQIPFLNKIKFKKDEKKKSEKIQNNDLKMKYSLINIPDGGIAVTMKNPSKRTRAPEVLFSKYSPASLINLLLITRFTEPY